MTTTDLGKVDAFLAALAEHGLLAADALEQARAFRQAVPGRGTRELTGWLVEQGLLTRYQIDAVLRGEGGKLLLSHFTLVDVIGSGSMGTVYRARSARDDGLYAVKIVPRRNVVNLHSIAEKVQALEQVRHPRVSALVHVGAQGERVYMAWPLLEGGDKLDAIVHKQGRLPPRQSAQVALQVAMGLQAYHQHNLFHGLLKPSDILIGSDRRVRILDFGVGFLLTCERGKALLDTSTNSKAMARGLDCASPESILDPLNRTPAGDQYSLGCILYFCLTGRFPFIDGNPVKKMLAHQFHEPPSVRELAPECPLKLAAIVHRLLRKQPEERYADTGEVVEALQAVAADTRSAAPVPVRGPAVATTPIPAPPVVPSARWETMKQEGPCLVPEPEPKLLPRERGRGHWWLALAAVAAGVAAGIAAWLLYN